MGSFGLKISKSYITPPVQNYTASNAPKGFVVEEENKDGPFQKALAYTSYYNLVFVTICMFMPSKVASAASKIESILPF